MNRYNNPTPTSPAEDLAMMEVEALKVPCPDKRCRAEVDEWCINPSTHRVYQAPALRVHRARVPVDAL